MSSSGHSAHGTIGTEFTAQGETDDRIAAVRRYEILDSVGDATLDRVARLAAATFDAAIGSVTIVDVDRIWFVATAGLDGVRQIDLTPGLCASAIQHDEPYVVADAAVDPRTLDHPLVGDDVGLRFYAAAPIVTADGHRLGTVNAMDSQPRDVTDQQTDVLIDLAGIVMDHLDLRLAALKAMRRRRYAMGRRR